MSLHRRRHHSLPSRRRRSPAALALAAFITTAGVAWGARQLRDTDAVPMAPR